MSVDANLQTEVNKLNASFLNPKHASNESDLMEFMLTMTICNTVVVNKRPHKDNMSEYGLVERKPSMEDAATDATQSPETTTLSRESAASVTGGDSRDKSSEEKSKEIPSAPTEPKIYEAESPDELAMVSAAALYGMKLLGRQNKKVKVEMPDTAVLEYEVLNVLKFDAVRKRMSVLVQSPNNDSVILLTKGADSSILTRLVDASKRTFRSKLHLFKSEESLQMYSSRGLRTLCLAKRILSRKEYEEWARLHAEAECSMDEVAVRESSDRIERELELLGVTGIEDKLQNGVPECIASLEKAGIKVWVLTGDKVETAVNIAYSCRLFSVRTDLIHIFAGSEMEADEVLEEKLKEIDLSEVDSSCSAKETGRKRLGRRRGLVLDGPTLANSIANEKFLALASKCSAVLCCRASPLQKAEVVKLVKKKLGARTLAIGDGANDVSMIQAADVGVGINGKEGMQAVLASDFALPRFRLLKKLLLVHGHWNYDRLARMIPYFMYKTLFVDPMFMQLYNLFFTTLPGMFVAVLDQSCEQRLLLAEPKLYATGRKSKLYNRFTFWITIADSIWQSLVVFYFPFFVYRSSTVSLHSFGYVMFFSIVLCTQAQLAVEIHAWMWPMVISMLFCVSSLLIFSLIYSTVVPPGINKNPPRFEVHMTLSRPINWFIILFVTTLAIFIRLTLKIFKNSLRPSNIIRARIQMLLREEQEEKKSWQ